MLTNSRFSGLWCIPVHVYPGAARQISGVGLHKSRRGLGTCWCFRRCGNFGAEPDPIYVKKKNGFDAFSVALMSGRGAAGTVAQTLTNSRSSGLWCIPKHISWCGAVNHRRGPVRLHVVPDFGASRCVYPSAERRIFGADLYGSTW